MDLEYFLSVALKGGELICSSSLLYFNELATNAATLQGVELTFVHTQIVSFLQHCSLFASFIAALRRTSCRASLLPYSPTPPPVLLLRLSLSLQSLQPEDLVV